MILLWNHILYLEPPSKNNRLGVRNLVWKRTIRTLLLGCRSHTFTVNYVHPSGWFCSAAPHMIFCCVKFDDYLWVIGSFFRFSNLNVIKIYMHCVFVLPYSTLRLLWTGKSSNSFYSSVIWLLLFASRLFCFVSWLHILLWCHTFYTFFPDNFIKKRYYLMLLRF